MRAGRLGGVAALVLFIVLAGAGNATAHPHVFVTAKERVLFGADGRITGIAAAWTFDDMYSSFATQGLGDPDKILTKAELAPLAKTNVDSLAEFGWFTVGKTGGKPVLFDDPTDYWLDESPDKLITLHFTLPLKTPTKTGSFFTLLVYDPTYFVAFEFDEKEPVTLVGAPSGCSVSVAKPKSLDNTDSQKLSEAFFTNMSPGMDFGIKLAPRGIIACP